MMTMILLFVRRLMRRRSLAYATEEFRLSDPYGTQSRVIVERVRRPRSSGAMALRIRGPRERVTAIVHMSSLQRASCAGSD